MKLTFYAHASFRLEAPEASILADPSHRHGSEAYGEAIARGALAPLAPPAALQPRCEPIEQVIAELESLLRTTAAVHRCLVEGYQLGARAVRRHRVRQPSSQLRLSTVRRPDYVLIASLRMRLGIIVQQT